MHVNQHTRRNALFTCCIAAIAAMTALCSAPASFAAVNTCGSGASVQKSIQEVWTKEYSTLVNPDKVSYNSTTNGEGLEDFGYTGASTLKADAKCGSGELDGYIGVDSPPTAAELALAKEATGGVEGVVVPVGQVPEALLISLPTGITVNTGDSLALSNAVAAELYAGTIPATANYHGNTWGALLEAAFSEEANAKFTRTSSTTPGLGQFHDSGKEAEKTGGFSTITVQVRANGAGATLALKQYFIEGLAAGSWAGITVDENTEGAKEWPAGAATDGFNTSDSIEAEKTANTPGEVGYSTLGAATLVTPTPFSLEFLLSTEGGEHFIVWALLQDNQGDTPILYADPLAKTSPKEPNVYTGAAINVNKSGGVGQWEVPETGGKFNPLGDWTGSHAWDPDVYLDSGSAGNYYPLIIGLYDLCWEEYDVGNLVAPLYKEPPVAVGELVKGFLKWVTGNGLGEGQEFEKTGSEYFAPLPTGGSGTADIREDAHLAAETCAS